MKSTPLLTPTKHFLLLCKHKALLLLQC